NESALRRAGRQDRTRRVAVHFPHRWTTQIEGGAPMRASSSLVCALAIVAQSSALSAQSRFLDANGVRIHYTVTGTGPAVVLIHGWGLNLREWTDQIAALSPHYRVIAFDRRGFGKSTGDSDPSAEPADVRALLDTLGIRSATLVAHSAGAVV